jgi:hypothetical protein
MLLVPEAPHGEQEKDGAKDQYDAHLRQYAEHGRILCHQALVAFEGMGVGGEIGQGAHKASRAEDGLP